jgi:hypothetical protein
MKWFDRWFYRHAKKAWESRDEMEELAAQSMTSAQRSIKIGQDRDDPHDLLEGLRIVIKKVIGGTLVTFRHYDSRTDRADQRTYIITEEQDFEKELGKCITMESLRR